MKSLYQLIHKSTLVALCVVSCAMFSCEGDEGPEGPIGPQGEQGEQGTPGAQGPKGEDALIKAGYAEGTIEGTRQDGTPFTESFKYEYAFQPLEIVEYDQITFSRFNGGSINIYSESNYQPPHFDVRLYFESQQSGEEVVTPGWFSFAFNKELEGPALFYFDADYYTSESSSSFEITNYEHNATTGIVTFDFKFTDIEGGYNNSTDHAVTIIGKFNSGTKVYKNVLMREL